VSIDDKDYYILVKDILDNKTFKMIGDIEHHGISRLDHSIKVSYNSYKIAKMLGLDYKDAARGGLLHDFFLSKKDRTQLERFLSTFTHPKIAVKNSINEFNVNKRQQDMIKSHMFPINLTVPKYAESWIVNLVDKAVGSFEFGVKFKYHISCIVNIYVVILLNLIK
jgi:uncharacterized protein